MTTSDFKIRENAVRELGEKLSRNSIPALDALRAIAVFLVIFYHFGFDAIDGAMGVEIFFVLSGFLITWLLLKENQRTGSISFSSFYKRRTLRIFPAFYAYWLLGLSIDLLRKHEILWGPVTAAFFYVTNYYAAIVHPKDTYVSHTWSLAIEEQFYLLWPLIFWFCRNNLRKMSFALVGIIASVWIYRSVLQLVFSVNQGYLYHAFDTRLDHLMVGCLLAVVMKREVLQAYWRALCSSRIYAFIPPICLAASSVLDRTFTYRYVFGYAIEPLLIASWIVQLIYFSSSRGWSWVQHPVLRYLGRISYSLYLYQQITLFTARRLTSNFPVVVQLIFAILVTIAFASASYFVIEKPFLKLKDREHARADERQLRAVGTS